MWAEYWAICFSGSRLSHQCKHLTFVGSNHLTLDFHFSWQRTRSICLDCGAQNSSQYIRPLEITQTFYVFTFQETFSSDAIFWGGRKVGEETQRWRKGTNQKASETYVRWGLVSSRIVQKTGQTRMHLGHMLSDEKTFLKEYSSAFCQSITSKDYSGPKWGHVMKRREKPI